MRYRLIELSIIFYSQSTRTIWTASESWWPTSTNVCSRNSIKSSLQVCADSVCSIKVLVCQPPNHTTLHFYVTVVKKLENSIYKFYIINALANNKSDKVTEFFVKMAPEIQGQTEWKEWYGKLTWSWCTVSIPEYVTKAFGRSQIVFIFMVTEFLGKLYDDSGKCD